MLPDSITAHFYFFLQSQGPRTLSFQGPVLTLKHTAGAEIPLNEEKLYLFLNFWKIIQLTYSSKFQYSLHNLDEQKYASLFNSPENPGRIYQNNDNLISYSKAKYK